MPLRRWIACLAATLTLAGGLQSPSLAATAETSFVAIPLGTTGGLHEDDLSAYLLAPKGSSDFISLDAGTLSAGLRKAANCGTLAPFLTPADGEWTPAGAMLRHHVRAYLISHAHLDHIAGLVLNSPDDSRKDILGTAPTLDRIRDHLFNWQIWPAFGNEGNGFLLKKYRYVRLETGKAVPVGGTTMTVEPWTLSHSDGYPSTAFLIGAQGSHVLYCGDTGPDAVEKATALQQVWQRVAPLVQARSLRGIFLEVSYPDGTPDKALFGHLTPAWMMIELRTLARMVDPVKPQDALKGLTVVVTHIKPVLKPGPPVRERILQELQAQNDLGIRFVLPEQGKRLEL
jgi:3',5'-cyclic-nucleotide phosphodiesterase